MPETLRVHGINREKPERYRFSDVDNGKIVACERRIILLTPILLATEINCEARFYGSAQMYGVGEGGREQAMMANQVSGQSSS